ncbi:MAG: hypothetical protein RL434_2745 [Pseudomonadota bacterium]
MPVTSWFVSDRIRTVSIASPFGRPPSTPGGTPPRREYRAEYGEALFFRLREVCCVRNPWDRVVSHYFSPGRGAVSWCREDVLGFIKGPTVKPLPHYAAEIKLFGCHFGA